MPKRTAAAKRVQPRQYGKTDIVVSRNAEDLGQRAAADVSAVLRRQLRLRDRATVVFAAAESQVTFLRALAATPGIDWARVVCFNMDELWDSGLPDDCTCAALTRELLQKRVRPRAWHCICQDAADPEREARRFEGLLKRYAPIDIVCQGIGRSGHIALNEPGHTDFTDERWVRVVPIVEASRRQLAEDPHFSRARHIPESGITMTLPALFSARHLFTIVPYAAKRPIITRLLGVRQPTPTLPASLLRVVRGTLYLDNASCPRQRRRA